MLHVVNYAGQLFRVEIAEVVGTDGLEKTTYVTWCSEAFRDLKDAPKQACDHFVGESSFANPTEALGHARNWIKVNWDAQQAKRGPWPAGNESLLYVVSLFKGNTSTQHQFPEFSDAKLFAKAAEKVNGVTKVEITNNESPERLAIWEKAK